MPVYFSNENLNGNIPADASAGLPSSLADSLKTSAISTLLSQYVKLGFEQGKFSMVDDALEAIKTLCNEALSNGDISAEVYDYVESWMKSRSYSLESLNSVRPVESDELVKKCFNPAFAPDAKSCKLWKEFNDLATACDDKLTELTQSYGPHIRNYIGEFLRLYGKSLDKDIRAKLTF